MPKRPLNEQEAELSEKKVHEHANQISDMKLSEEQEEVVEAVCQRQNVATIARAGAGKTVTALSAAYHFFTRHQGQRTLLITYNARLKSETRVKIRAVGMDHMVEAHNYHAIAVNFFETGDGKDGVTDATIHRAMQAGPRKPLDFGLVVCDELQDCSDLYYRFLTHILRHLQRPPVMLLLGDPFQKICGFNGASDEYLIHPERCFGALCETPTFLVRYLTISWRITHEMAEFINTNLNPCNLALSHPSWWAEHGERIAALWGKGIRANPARRRAPDSLQIIRGWGAKGAVQAAQVMFRRFGNDQVALLAYTLSGQRTPIQAIVDKLGRHRNENWVVMDGTQGNSEEVMSGKRVAGTVHRFKGLERDGILYCGLDSWLEKKYERDPLEAFNINYVAVTRARQQLVVNVNGTDFATVRCCPLRAGLGIKQTAWFRSLVEYVPFDELLSVPERLFTVIGVDTIPERHLPLSERDLLVPGRAASTVEDLTPFLNRAITFRLTILVEGRLSLPFSLADVPPGEEDMVEFLEGLDLSSPDWTTLIRYAVACESVESRYLHLWRQLKGYEAEPKVRHILQTCVDNALSLLFRYARQQGELTEQPGTDEDDPKKLSPLLEFHVPVSFPLYVPWFTATHTGQINGTVDILFGGHTIMGIDCVDAPRPERALELLLLSAACPSARRTMMILTNSCQIVSLEPCFPPLSEHVPREYELIYRAARRKCKLTTEKVTLERDQNKWGTSSGRPEPK